MREERDDQIWVGVHDRFKTPEWVTVLDTTMDCIPWIAENPDYIGIEQCLALCIDGFNNRKCNCLLMFICEIKI
jgi:hypothetical protein